MKLCTPAEFEAAIAALGGSVADAETYQRLTTLALDHPSVAAMAALDPFSAAYRQAAMALYLDLRGRAESGYDPARDERSEAHAETHPFKGVTPWSFRDTAMMSEFLISWAHIFKALALPSGAGAEPARVLEYGPGSGQILLMLARMGVRAAGVDIDEASLESLRRQAAAMDLTVETDRAVFGEGFGAERFDRIIFFEAFHHAFEFETLLARLRERLAPGGRLILCGEPVVHGPAPSVPLPWSPRLDALSVFCMRRYGWMELGFTHEFLMEALRRAGYAVTFVPAPDCGRANTYIAEPLADVPPPAPWPLPAAEPEPVAPARREPAASRPARTGHAWARHAIAWLARRDPVAWSAGLLVLLYSGFYLAFPALPGNDTRSPLGWWGWFDQGQTLRSTAALAHANLDPAAHWYPLGYALLGAPFYRMLPLHPFVFVDLTALLASFAAFTCFAARLRVSARMASVIFLLTAAWDHYLFQQWVIPWNTTPTAAFVWLLLACAAAHLDGKRRPFAIGLLTGLIPLCRPTDLALAAPCVLAVLILDAIRLRRSIPTLASCWARMLAGFLIPVLAYLALYLRIYGPHPSEYMVISQRIGFTLHDFGWKAYVTLIDPTAWFLDGEGLLRRAPWIALGIAGLLPAMLRDTGRGRRLGAILATVLIVHAILYLSYVDLLPTGLWRYDNVHYFAWILPGYGLLAWLLLRDLRPRAWDVPPPARRLGWICLMGTLLVLCLHLNPTPARGGRVKAIDFPGARADYATAYSGDFALRDNRGTLDNIHEMRVIPYPGGLRAIAIRRDFHGPVSWVPAHAPDIAAAGAQAPFGMRITLGRPCWLASIFPFMGCPRAPARNEALPDFPGF